MLYKATVCPRSSDPFYIVSYYINKLLLLGHTVVNFRAPFANRTIEKKMSFVISLSWICQLSSFLRCSGSNGVPPWPKRFRKKRCIFINLLKCYIPPIQADIKILTLK